ncbi:MAG: nucleotide sugar dehydrogenase, partial [Desulfobacterales bacterium]|nr:nucleotide sugar dehydrogenase [Desulfobacterales bacterium]
MASKRMVVGVIGLGYVGLPVAVTFGRQYTTIGYDIKKQMIESYKKHVDPTGELSADELISAVHLEYTTEPSLLKRADVIIVAVPTPIDNARQP